MYPEELVLPMKEELTSVGFEDLTTSGQVADAINNTEGTILVVVNSVCGCAAGNARPAVKSAVQNDKRPDRIASVFAGFDVEATQEARKFMLPYPPSSPSMGLFKNGKLVHMIERHHIEGASADILSDNLVEAFNEHC
ncbi:MAG: BrxA/BrxB family bacilliredoxin [Bacteroidetes bacterium]|nr:BrxA/BrxB family bacilliredoxin [Bacteroidota bacterium]